MFSVSRKTVYNVLNRSEKEGKIEPKSGGGRKTKINKRVDRLIMRIVIASPRISVRALAQYIRQECHQLCHTKLCANSLYAIGTLPELQGKRLCYQKKAILKSVIHSQ